jgi:prevent-host-death family protein
MTQVTATEFKANFNKYLSLAEREDVVITKSGKSIVTLSRFKQSKVKRMESLFGIVPWDGKDIDIKQLKAERLAQKYESLD